MSEVKPLFGLGDKNENYKQFFIGDSYLNILAAQEGVMVANVTFEPGCRNDWHIHRDGYQVLLVTDGEGWYQEEGNEAQRITKGDVVVIKDGVKHWHGATKDSYMSHVAITTGAAEWYEKVEDEFYTKL